MSVNHYLLAITDAELDSLLKSPKEIHEFVERRGDDVVELGTDGVAIVALTAESEDDPLDFMISGTEMEDVAGWVGDAGDDGDEVDPDVDMGYGPASYYRNKFLRVVAEELEPISVDVFASNCDIDFLEANQVYPTGWHDKGRRESLIEAFAAYRTCVLAAAKLDRHLLVWTA